MKTPTAITLIITICAIGFSLLMVNIKIQTKNETIEQLQRELRHADGLIIGYKKILHHHNINETIKEN